MKPSNLDLNKFEKEILAQISDNTTAEQIAILESTINIESDPFILKDLQALLVKLKNQ